MEAELLNREHRAIPKFPANQNDQENDDQRHGEGKPLECPVAKPRRRRHLRLRGALVQRHRWSKRCHSERSEAVTQRTTSARPGFPSLVISVVSSEVIADNGQRLASCLAFRCSALLNMTERGTVTF